MAEEQKSITLKNFIFLLVIGILIMSFLFNKIQKKLMPSDPLKAEPKKSEENTAKIELNKPEKKNDNAPKKNEELNKTKSILTWSEFSQKFQHFENKRQEVLTQLEQKLPNNPPNKTISSLQTHELQIPINNEIDEEEKTSWGKVIQDWQQLNEQQQRLSKSNAIDEQPSKKNIEENQ